VAGSAEGWHLSGRPDPVVFGPVADVAIVITPDAVFAVELDDANVRPAAEPAMDQTRPLGWLQLDDTPATRLGGHDAADALIDQAATAASMELLGGASRVLELATQYAKDRVQFGKPIGSFQAVKHRCADMLVDVEGMRSAAWYAAWAVEAADDGRALAASTAK